MARAGVSGVTTLITTIPVRNGGRKDLKRLRRDELLEILIAQSKKMDQMQAELDAARAALDSRARRFQRSAKCIVKYLPIS